LQGSFAGGVGRVDDRAAFQKQQDDLVAAGFGGVMKRGCALVVFGLDVCALKRMETAAPSALIYFKHLNVQLKKPPHKSV
jgi:hypothetical protein